MSHEATVPVVAAVIVRDGLYLVGRRPGHKRHGGLWEFPGGKVHADESTLDAARRELDEELGLVVTSVGETLFTSRDPGAPFEIRFVEIEASGEPEAREHTLVGWYGAHALGELDLAPADARFVAFLLGR